MVRLPPCTQGNANGYGTLEWEHDYFLVLPRIPGVRTDIVVKAWDVPGGLAQHCLPWVFASTLAYL